MLTQHTKLPTTFKTSTDFVGIHYSNVLAFLFAIFYFANYWPMKEPQPALIWISSSLLLVLISVVAKQLPLFWATGDTLLKGLIGGWVLTLVVILVLLIQDGVFAWPLDGHSQFILGSSTALLLVRQLQLKHKIGRVTLCLVAATLVCWLVNSIAGAIVGQMMWSSRVLGGFLWIAIGMTVAALVFFLPPKTSSSSNKRKDLGDEPIFEQLNLYQDWLLLALLILQMSLSLYTLQITGSHHQYYPLQLLGMAALLALTASLALHFEQQTSPVTS